MGFHKINTLPRTKIIPLWLFIILISGLIINSIFTNLNYIAKPMKVDTYLSYLILQYLILPIAILTFINIYKLLSLSLKAFMTVFMIIISTVVEILVEKVGVIEYIGWNIGFSLLLWSLVILISIAFYHTINFQSSKRDGPHV